MSVHYRWQHYTPFFPTLTPSIDNLGTCLSTIDVSSLYNKPSICNLEICPALPPFLPTRTSFINDFGTCESTIQLAAVTNPYISNLGTCPSTIDCSTPRLSP